MYISRGWAACAMQCPVPGHGCSQARVESGCGWYWPRGSSASVIHLMVAAMYFTIGPAAREHSQGALTCWPSEGCRQGCSQQTPMNWIKGART